MHQDARAKADLYDFPKNQNPSVVAWSDPVKSLFVKTGGRRCRELNPKVGNAVARLERGMSTSGISGSNILINDEDLRSIQKMFSEKNCVWKFVNRSY